MNPDQNITDSKFKYIFFNHIWWLGLLGLIGVCIYIRYDAHVFPSASIDLKIPRSEIIHKARQLASELGYEKRTAIESTQFSVDEGAKTFLEYELGTDQANKLMKEELPLWSWRTRFCKQHEQEEFRIWLSTAGSLQAFSHEVENDRCLPSLSRPEAYKMACQFVQEKAGLSLQPYKLIRDASYTQSHRTDYSFTWEDTSRDFHGAKLRIHLGIAGNLIDQYNYFLYVPQAFERKFSAIRSSNEDLESIASVFYSLLQVLSVFIFFWAVSTKRIRWRFAIVVASIAVFIDTLESFNDITSVIDSYNTEKLFSGYLFEFVIQVLIGCLSKFVSYLMLAGAAELIYRISYPKKVACENILNPKTYTSKSFINGSILGHILVGINLGWIVAYYLSGKYWHFWCPSGIDSYQLLSTVFPFFSAISTGISAAINEEFLYRVLALSLFQRLIRSFWLANIFQAIAWGFMHSTYPQEPAYARGLELTIIGLIYGWILRRYGLWPCLVGHYLFDALLSVKPLFGTDDFWLKASAIIPIVPFFLLFIFAYMKVKALGYTSEQGLQNSSVIKASPRLAKGILAVIKEKLKQGSLNSDIVVDHIPVLSKRTVLFLFGLLLLNLVLAFPLSNYPAVNKEANIALSRDEILVKASQELVRHNINPRQYKSVITLSDETDSLDIQYIFEQEKLKRTLRLADETKQGLYWRVFFFRPLDPTSYEVWLHDNGRIAAFSLIEPEDAAGANLTEELAKVKAESYLRINDPDWQPYKFENSLVNKHQARTDYTFVFTVPRLEVKEARFKVTVAVVGDILSGSGSSYDLPDHWLNERNKKTAKDEILLQVRTVFNAFMLLAGLLWAFGLLKSGQIKWQSAYFCTFLFIGLSLIQQINDFPQFYHAYSTTEPLYSYILQQITSYMQSIQSSFLYYFACIALAIAALHTVAQDYKLRAFVSFLVLPVSKESAQTKIWMNSWLIAFSAASLHTFINIISDCLHSQFSPGCPQEALSSICALTNVASPMLLLFTDALASGLNQLVFVAIWAGLYKRFCSGFPLYLVFIIVLNLLTHSSMRYWQDYLIDVASSSIWEISIWYFIVRIIGINPLAYFLIGFMENLLSNLLDLIQHGCPAYASSIALCILLILAPLIYSFYLRIKSQESEPIVVDQSS